MNSYNDGESREFTKAFEMTARPNDLAIKEKVIEQIAFRYVEGFLIPDDLETLSFVQIKTIDCVIVTAKARPTIQYEYRLKNSYFPKAGQVSAEADSVIVRSGGYFTEDEIRRCVNKLDHEFNEIPTDGLRLVTEDEYKRLSSLLGESTFYAAGIASSSDVASLKTDVLDANINRLYYARFPVVVAEVSTKKAKWIVNISGTDTDMIVHDVVSDPGTLKDESTKKSVKISESIKTRRTLYEAKSEKAKKTGAGLLYGGIGALVVGLMFLALPSIIYIAFIIMGAGAALLISGIVKFAQSKKHLKRADDLRNEWTDYELQHRRAVAKIYNRLMESIGSKNIKKHWWLS